jgi:hypothetical protein
MESSDSTDLEHSPVEIEKQLLPESEPEQQTQQPNSSTLVSSRSSSPLLSTSLNTLVNSTIEDETSSSTALEEEIASRAATQLLQLEAAEVQAQLDASLSLPSSSFDLSMVTKPLESYEKTVSMTENSTSNISSLEQEQQQEQLVETLSTINVSSLDKADEVVNMATNNILNIPKKEGNEIELTTSTSINEVKETLANLSSSSSSSSSSYSPSYSPVENVLKEDIRLKNTNVFSTPRLEAAHLLRSRLDLVKAAFDRLADQRERRDSNFHGVTRRLADLREGGSFGENTHDSTLIEKISTEPDVVSFDLTASLSRLGVKAGWSQTVSLGRLLPLDMLTREDESSGALLINWTEFLQMLEALETIDIVDQSNSSSTSKNGEISSTQSTRQQVDHILDKRRDKEVVGGGGGGIRKGNSETEGGIPQIYPPQLSSISRSHDINTATGSSINAATHMHLYQPQQQHQQYQNKTLSNTSPAQAAAVAAAAAAHAAAAAAAAAAAYANSASSYGNVFPTNSNHYYPIPPENAAISPGLTAGALAPGITAGTLGLTGLDVRSPPSKQLTTQSISSSHRNNNNDTIYLNSNTTTISPESDRSSQQNISSQQTEQGMTKNNYSPDHILGRQRSLSNSFESNASSIDGEESDELGNSDIIGLQIHSNKQYNSATSGGSGSGSDQQQPTTAGSVSSSITSTSPTERGKIETLTLANRSLSRTRDQRGGGEGGGRSQSTSPASNDALDSSTDLDIDPVISNGASGTSSSEEDTVNVTLSVPLSKLNLKSSSMSTSTSKPKSRLPYVYTLPSPAEGRGGFNVYRNESSLSLPSDDIKIERDHQNIHIRGGREEERDGGEQEREMMDTLPTDDEVINQVLADIATEKYLQRRKQQDQVHDKTSSKRKDGSTTFNINTSIDPITNAAASLSNKTDSTYRRSTHQQLDSQQSFTIKSPRSVSNNLSSSASTTATTTVQNIGSSIVHKPLDAVLHRYAPSLKLLFNAVAFAQNKKGATDSFSDYERRALSVNKAELMRCCRVLGLTGPQSLLTKTDVENVFNEMIRMPRHHGRQTLDEAAFIEALARVALISTSQPPLSTIYPSDGDRVDFVFQRAGLSNHLEVARRLRNHEFHFGGGFGSSGNSISPLLLKEATVGAHIGTVSLPDHHQLGLIGSDIIRVRDSHSHRYLAPPTPQEELEKRRDIRIAAARVDRSTSVIAQAMSSTSPSHLNGSISHHHHQQQQQQQHHHTSPSFLQNLNLPSQRFIDTTNTMSTGIRVEDDNQTFSSVRLSPSLARSGVRNLNQDYMFSSPRNPTGSINSLSHLQENNIGKGGGGTISRAYSQASSMTSPQPKQLVPTSSSSSLTVSHPIDTAAELITVNFVSTGLSPKRKLARVADAEKVAQGDSFTRNHNTIQQQQQQQQQQSQIPPLRVVETHLGQSNHRLLPQTITSSKTSIITNEEKKLIDELAELDTRMLRKSSRV